MKKLTLLALLLLGSSIAINTYAADELDELDALLNDEETTTTNDTGSTTDTTGEDETTTADTANDGDTATTDDLQDLENLDDTATQTENAVTNQKVGLSVTDNPTTDSVTLIISPVDGYIDYKIYYAKEGDEENLAETGIVIDHPGTETITIKGLEAGNTYVFRAKAFDQDGNPVESTTSDPVKVTLPEWEKHAAPADNVIYDPVVKVEWKKIKITYKPGADVKKVQISISEDGKVFKPVATIDATQTEYEIPVETTGKKFIKIVPIAEDGTLGVCKIGATEVPYVTATVEAKKKAQTNMGKPKTGPETTLLMLLAILVAVGYLYRRQRA